MAVNLDSSIAAIDEKVTPEVLLRIAALVVGVRAVEVVGEENFGWNKPSVQALEAVFAELILEEDPEAVVFITACLGDFVRLYIGGAWVFGTKIAPNSAGNAFERGDFKVRLSKDDAPTGTTFTQDWADGGIFDPAIAVRDWHEGMVASPFIPLYHLVGEPPEMLLPVKPASSRPKPLEPLKPLTLKPRKKR